MVSILLSLSVFRCRRTPRELLRGSSLHGRDRVGVPQERTLSPASYSAGFMLAALVTIATTDFSACSMTAVLPWRVSSRSGGRMLNSLSQSAWARRTLGAPSGNAVVFSRRAWCRQIAGAYTVER